MNTYITYYVDDNGVLHIYDNYKIMADIHDCAGMPDDELDELVMTIVEELLDDTK